MAETEKPEFKANLVIEDADGALISIQIKRPRPVAGGDEVSKTVLAFEFKTTSIDRYVGILARLLRKDRPVTVGLAFVEQLELPKATAEQNGHGPATGGLTPIEGGKGSKKKSREKEGAKA